MYFELGNPLDASGVLEVELPNTGVLLTTQSSCKWSQGETTGNCIVATVISNQNTITFNDGTNDFITN